MLTGRELMTCGVVKGRGGGGGGGEAGGGVVANEGMQTKDQDRCEVLYARRKVRFIKTRPMRCIC